MKYLTIFLVTLFSLNSLLWAGTKSGAAKPVYYKSAIECEMNQLLLDSMGKIDPTVRFMFQCDDQNRLFGTVHVDYFFTSNQTIITCDPGKVFKTFLEPFLELSIYSAEELYNEKKLTLQQRDAAVNLLKTARDKGFNMQKLLWDIQSANLETTFDCKPSENSCGSLSPDAGLCKIKITVK